VIGCTKPGGDDVVEIACRHTPHRIDRDTARPVALL
jgi:hypothetical protein